MAESPRPKVDRKARLQIPPQLILKHDPLERCNNWEEVVIGLSPEAAMIEATRCIQCPAVPCIKACPVQNDIPGALWLLESGDFIGAANKFRETSTMPDVCGRICPQERLCEGDCVVGNNPKINVRPVAIGRLEAFVADHQRKTDGLPRPPAVEKTGKRAAVIGAGPAGMTVAELLASKGHSVTILDNWPEPGGILRYGIPNFKLGKSIVEDKVALLRDLGVEFISNVTVGREVSVSQLQDEYDAVYLGHGASIGASPNVPGEHFNGVYYATDFLVRGNLTPHELPEGQKEKPKVGKRVVVIGGGDTSSDCVRTAVRLGAEDVTCLYRRTESEMPGRIEERTHAKEEGVKYFFLAAPLRFMGDDDGNVTGVECVQMELGEPDASGRPRPVAKAGSEFVVPADTVVMAVGYWADEEFAQAIPGLETQRGGRIVIDSETGETSVPGLFAGGDSVRGADLVVTAIADAQRAAAAMDAYLQSLSSTAESAYQTV
ncbi:MAG: NAD(P)-dependent oxidoreductase [Dehalococcoidia bacterium]|nr:NAD(P)-dependent oxidoreductase [Dehalococcoidia bacterium]